MKAAANTPRTATFSEKRDRQKAQTREKILEALVESLLTVGYGRTTTMEVQRRAGVSRGALLHHFPTRASLFEAAVWHLVDANERAIREAVDTASPDLASIERAIHVLAEAMRRPAYTAELELWAAARTDLELRAVLRQAERVARKKNLDRVVHELFGEPWISAPRFRIVSGLTVELLRGLATTRALRVSPTREATLVAQWSELARLLLTTG